MTPSSEIGASETAALSAPVSTLVARPPLWIAADASVRDAARRMRDAGAGSILVEAAEAGPGIVTDRDLRGRVLAEGRSPETPIGEVASRPLLTLPADAPIVGAHLRLLEAGIHHLALVDERETIVGVVSSSDLLRHQNAGPFTVLHRLDADLDGQLPTYTGLVENCVRSLVDGGLDASRVAHVVSALNDQLTRRLLRRAIDSLGVPPVDWAWVVFGSEGRREQTLLTDQDNALIYGDPSAADDAETYFRDLAEILTGDLLTAGFPPCPGGYMARTWRAPLGAWTRRFRGWIESGEGDAVLRASVFFDFRQVDGALDLSPLQGRLDEAGEHGLFRHRLFEQTRDFRPPIGLFGRLRTGRHGTIDLKAGGVAPVVGLARIAGLAAGCRDRGTVERLRAAAEAGTLARETADHLESIFRFLLDLRLRRQLAARAAGEPASSAVRPADLSAVDRDRLKHSLRRVGRILDALALRW